MTIPMCAVNLKKLTELMNGRTGHAFARQCGLRHETIKQILETGRAMPKTIDKLSRALGVPEEELKLGKVFRGKLRDAAQCTKGRALTYTIYKVNRELILRAMGDLTQKDFAEKCGLDKNTISSVMQTGRARQETIIKLRSGCGVARESLILGTIAPKKMRRVRINRGALLKAILDTFESVKAFSRERNLSGTTLYRTLSLRRCLPSTLAKICAALDGYMPEDFMYLEDIE